MITKLNIVLFYIERKIYHYTGTSNINILFTLKSAPVYEMEYQTRYKMKNQCKDALPLRLICIDSSTSNERLLAVSSSREKSEYIC